MKTLDSTLNECYQDRLGRRITSRLADSTSTLPNDISERLKSARMQALAKRKVVQLQSASGVSLNGGAATVTMGGDSNGGLWTRLGSLIPLLLLVFGLLAIEVIQEQHRVDELAEVDTELLADDLPPAAYTDPGFVQFLKTIRRD